MADALKESRNSCVLYNSRSQIISFCVTCCQVGQYLPGSDWAIVVAVVNEAALEEDSLDDDNEDAVVDEAPLEDSLDDDDDDTRGFQQPYT